MSVSDTVSGMKEGALVLADCLGFRGIWNRVDPEKLLAKLQSIEKDAAVRVMPKYTATMMSFGPIRFHVRLLSDTVALSVQYEAGAYEKGAQPNERQKNLLVSVACESAAVLAHLFIDSDVPLPLRGCISFGYHLCDGNFLVGPAVDQAAEYMNEPEGAFIWVLPGVIERQKSFLDRALELINAPDELVLSGTAIAALRGVDDATKLLAHPEVGSDLFMEALRMTYTQILSAPLVIEPYAMPIKRGMTIDAGIINPFLSVRDDQDRKRIRARYEQFLQGDRIEIWTKRQNTLKFLAVAEEAAAKFHEMFDKDKQGESRQRDGMTK